MDDNPSILSHVSVGVADLDRAAAFYDAVLGALGIGRVVDLPVAIAYGRAFPEFWIGLPFDGGAASAGNGAHVGFLARSRAEVDAFWEAALASGGTGDGAPGPRADYGPGYWGAYARDPDGNKVEAQWSDPAAAGEAAGKAEAPLAAAEPEAHPS